MTALLENEKPIALTEVAAPAPTPQLHLRLVRQAVPAPQRLTGKAAARMTLELALKLPLAEALAKSIETLAEPGALSAEQVARMTGLAMKLISDGLRMDDAVSIALHEPAHLRPSVPLPETLRKHLFPPNLTGENVLKLALELNHGGTRMDEAIVAALKKFAAPRPVTPEQASAVLEAAQQLFKEGRAIAEAFDIALKRTLPKGHWLHGSLRRHTRSTTAVDAIPSAEKLPNSSGACCGQSMIASAPRKNHADVRAKPRCSDWVAYKLSAVNKIASFTSAGASSRPSTTENERCVMAPPIETATSHIICRLTRFANSARRHTATATTNTIALKLIGTTRDQGPMPA